MTQYWQCNHSFGYWKSLVAGYKHTLTKARVIITKLEAGKAAGRRMEVHWLHGLMMCHWVVLGKMIGLVGIARVPKYMILSLTDPPIVDPIKPHVNGSGTFLCDVVIGNAGGCGVVSLNGGGGLGMLKIPARQCTGDMHVWH